MFSDQRIADDIERFSFESIAVLEVFIWQPFALLWYGYQSWKIGYWVPPMVLSYFIVFALIMKLPMNALMRQVITMERLEGDFRFAHTMAKRQAEAIALTDGGAIHRKDADAKFSCIINSQARLNIFGAIVKGLQQFYCYSCTFISYLAVVQALYWGLLGVEGQGVATVISQSCTIIMTFFYRLSLFTDLTESISRVSGYGYRLIELAWRLEESTDCGASIHVQMASGNVPVSQKARRSSSAEVVSIVYDKVDLYSPEEKLLVYGFSVRVWPGMNAVIYGPSGSGKSSLVRLLAGVWNSRHGSAYVSIPPNITRLPIMFLSQNPVLISGSLVDQLYYPVEAPKALPSDVDIKACLQAVSMAQILNRLGGSGDPLQRVLSYSEWSNLMSSGEIQRIVLARLFLHRPIFAVLDEATNAIEVVKEQEIYELLWATGITTISITHRTGFVFDNASISIGLDGHGNHQVEQF